MVAVGAGKGKRRFDLTEGLPSITLSGMAVVQKPKYVKEEAHASAASRGDNEEDKGTPTTSEQTKDRRP